uniref:Uncharacterized protein n=1 Tax=viral metagenome TaxID=1070528 RepID=A0A6C0CIR4_9ZZZZ
MEQEIHFTKKEFDFKKISLSQPVAVQGGAYFTKIKYNSEPFYIQTPKCQTKQGINETSKKAYVDLMYSNEAEEVIEWFETLESTLINLIFSKKHLWFQDDIDFGDIENFFNPITRAYRGGKFHLIRTSISKNKSTNQYSCGVYDENENILPITDISEKNIIIPILEIIGIKFSARNFQLELVGKQIMVLNNKPLFNSCLIKRNNNSNKTITDNLEEIKKTETIEGINDTDNDYKENKQIQSDIIKEEEEQDSNNIIDELLDNSLEEQSEQSEQSEKNNKLNEINSDEMDNTNHLEEIQSNEIKDNDLEDNHLEDNHLEDHNLENDNLENDNLEDGNLEDISENIQTTSNQSITLKNPNEVYMEIYKIAKQKAKQHKKAAISAYLEAKKIKNTYLLEDLDNSDDSSDNEDEYNDTENIKKEIRDSIEELN